MRVHATWLASSLLVGCTFGSLTAGGGGVTIGGDDDGTTGSGGGGPTAGPGDDATTDSAPAPTDGVDDTGGCLPGHEGCTCSDRACEAGLQCLGGTCVVDTCGDGNLDADEICDDGNVVLGDGCDACVPTPGVKNIAAGALHTCALLWSGAVRCWGEGAQGRLGYGNDDRIGDTEHPYEAGDVPLGGSAVAISAGRDFTCALLDDATVRCWGNDASGRLGNRADEPIGDDEPASASPVVSLGDDAVQIACGEEHCCAVRADNSLVCWGEGSQGRLGYGSQEDVGLTSDPADAGAVDLDDGVKQVAAGAQHTCAVLVNDDLYCWGSGGNGRLGYGDNTSIAEGSGEVPSDAGRVPMGADVQAVRLGEAHTCALLVGGGVRCWGQNSAGQCGIEGGSSIGDEEDEVPSELDDLPLGQPVVAIGARGSHSCAALEDGTVRCWGEGDLGRLGYGDTEDVFAPKREPVAISADQFVVRIAAGGEHTCAQLDLGNVRCWGRGDTGALGYADVESIGDDPRESPEQAGDVKILDR